MTEEVADTLYSLGYFSEDEANDLLELFTSEKRPLTLPNSEDVERAVTCLKQAASSGKLDAGTVLLMYQRLRESHSGTDVFCGWTRKDGKKCGARMNIVVKATGAYYECRNDPSHTTPK